MDLPADDLSDDATEPPERAPWQIRFEPGVTRENVERIADFAIAEGIGALDSWDFLRAGRDPQFWFSGTMDAAEVAAQRTALRKALRGEPLTEPDRGALRGTVGQFDTWLRHTAYSREEIYDADDTFFDFD